MERKISHLLPKARVGILHLRVTGSVFYAQIEVDSFVREIPRKQIQSFHSSRQSLPSAISQTSIAHADAMACMRARLGYANRGHRIIRIRQRFPAEILHRKIDPRAWCFPFVARGGLFAILIATHPITGVQVAVREIAYRRGVISRALGIKRLPRGIEASDILRRGTVKFRLIHNIPSKHGVVRLQFIDLRLARQEQKFGHH